MSYVTAAPEMLAAAAADLATIDSSLSAAHTAAAAPTFALVPAAADEVSASIAHLFSQHAEDYQALAGQAAAFHEQFIQHLNASARSYASTEAANTSSLRSLNASTGSHASANAGAQNLSLLPVNVTFDEALVLLLFLITGQLELALPLLLLLHLGVTF
ncbi:MAG: PE family protein [Mycobacterium sp.]